jgi:hypothetical protein
MKREKFPNASSQRRHGVRPSRQTEDLRKISKNFRSIGTFDAIDITRCPAHHCDICHVGCRQTG